MGNEKNNKIFLVFMTSLIISLSMLITGNQIVKSVIHRRMLLYALASARESDGAQNLVVMDGYSGFIGSSMIELKYKEDGFILIKGTNQDETDQWKQIAEIELVPGIYTLAGLKGSSQDVVALRLHLKGVDGAVTNYWQFDEDVQFTVAEQSHATLSVRVNQYAKVNTIARPAVYKDE